MLELVVVYLPYILSAITVYTVVLAGNNNRNAWLISMFNQLLWLIWIVASNTWGLLPMNITLWIAFYRNYMKWGKKEQLLS